MAIDPRKGYSDGPLGPARQSWPIVKDDVNGLPIVTKRIWIGSGGSIALRLADGADVTYQVVGGRYLEVQAAWVRNVGTSATDLVGEA